MDEDQKRQLRERGDARDALMKARATLRAVARLVGASQTLNDVESSDLAFLLDLIDGAFEAAEFTIARLDEWERDRLEQAA